MIVEENRIKDREREIGFLQPKILGFSACTSKQQILDKFKLFSKLILFTVI